MSLQGPVVREGVAAKAARGPVAILNYHAHLKADIWLLQVEQPDVGFGRGESVIEDAVVAGQPVFDDWVR